MRPTHGLFQLRCCLKGFRDILKRMWPERIKAVYVLCHPEKEEARFKRLIPHFISVGIPEEKLIIHAPTWGSDLTVGQIFSHYDPYLQRGLPSFSFKAPNLTKGEISLGINLATAILDAASKYMEPEDMILIFESDVWLRADFVPRLHTLLEDVQNRSWDYISLGEGVGTRPPGVHPSYYAPTKAYKPPHEWVFRCTDSMLFKASFLRRISPTVLPFKEIVDWEMNYQCMRHNGIPLWADPPLAEQGTCNARVITTLPC